MLRKKLKNKVLSFLVRKLLKGITEEDILRMTGDGGIIYRGRHLSKEDADAIRSNAEVLHNSKVLKLLLLDVKYLAQQTMFERSSSYDDMMFGKAILYTVEILEKKIKNLSR